MPSKAVDIVGAGPAGLAAAIVLARAGREVVVYDKGDAPGGRFAGDFQGIENWTSTENVLDTFRHWGIELDEAVSPKYAITAYAPDGQARSIRTNAPIFYLVSRGGNPGTLDTRLLNQAREAGVRFEFGGRIDRVGELPAVVATGPRFGHAVCIGYVFETDLEDTVAVVLDDECAPKGYGYLLVHEGRATIASTQFTDFNKSRQHLRATVAFMQAKYPIDLSEARPFSGFANVFFPRSYRENNRYYVGEAAGLQDPLWGFGMRYAMLSGCLAARSILDGSSYDRAVRRELLPFVKAGLVNRVLIEMLAPRWYGWLLDHLARQADPHEVVRKHHQFTLLRRIALPLVRRSLRSRVRFVDRACHSSGCRCVWCSGGHERPSAVRAHTSPTRHALAADTTSSCEVCDGADLEQVASAAPSESKRLKIG